MVRLAFSVLFLYGCAALFDWNGGVQREYIEEEHGEILKEYRLGERLVFVWRQGPHHYNKWICNMGYYHNCFDGYGVDQIARTCTLSHEGPEQVIDCAGLRRDPDLAVYVTW
jgi:hypothetical protein